jgi:uncharacterized membrane protein
MALSMGSLILFAHILAAMVLVGSSLFAPLVRRGMKAAVSAADLAGWLDLGRRAAALNPPASLALLGTGIYLGLDGWWTQAWFWVAVGAWLVNASLATLVVRRAAAALGIANSRPGDGAVSADADRLRRSRAWDLAAGIMTANDIALLYVMVDKPTLVQSIAVLTLANLAALGAGLVRERSPRLVKAQAGHGR